MSRQELQKAAELLRAAAWNERHRQEWARQDALAAVVKRHADEVEAEYQRLLGVRR